MPGLGSTVKVPTHKRGQVLRNAPKSCFGGWGELLNKYVDLGTQRELAPISDRAEGRIDCAHARRIIIHHHSSNRTVPGDDPESLEYHFAVNTILLFICSRVSDPLIYAKHLTDFSELPQTMYRKHNPVRKSPEMLLTPSPSCVPG